MKKFIIRGTISLLLAIALVIGVFIFIQYQFYLESKDKNVETGKSNLDMEIEDTREPVTDEVNVETPIEGIPVSELPISDNQQKVLDTVGIDTESMVITPEMIECAKEELGEGRYNEVIGGAAPSPLEALALMKCT